MAIGSLRLYRMRLLLISCAAFGYAAVAGAQTSATKSRDCAGASTQAALTECYTLRARAADSAVKQAYARVLAGSNAKRRVLLRSSQRAWLAYRDAYCRYDALQYQGGSLYSTELGACLVELSDARTEELLSDWSSEHETGGSAPSDT